MKDLKLFLKVFNKNILNKGMGFPLISVPIINAIVFGHYEFWKRIMHIKEGEDFNFS